MRKIVSFIVLFLFGFLLFGCQEDIGVLSVMTPSGAPALAQMYVQEEAENYLVDVVVGADPLVAAFGSGSHDFIFAPTNLGAKLFQSNQDYIFLAAITFGNYYLITVQDSTFTMSDLEGKEIIVFGQNQTSDIIIQFLLNSLEIDCTITYVDSVATATASFIADSSKIIMIAEPSLSVLTAQISNIDIIDLQAEYQTITGDNSYPQAGVFGKASLSKNAINTFLNDLEASIESVNDDVEAAATLAVDLEFGFPYAVLVNAIPNSHLGFVSAQDAKTSLETYFNLILEINPGLIGNVLPSTEFYYQP
ncbi:MAG: hypothetical protein KJ971_07245 [Firmicutes bacterium]|nr:hypothetical protein [Bacillota bacterium]